jgi:hypothetical protein
LETGDALIAALGAVSKRTPRLPLADEVITKEVFGDLYSRKLPTAQWMRLMANFPVAGKRMVVGMIASQDADQLSPKLQAEINWVVARQDRAWFAAAVAKDELAKQGLAIAGLNALDGDLSVDGDNAMLSKADRALLTVAKNLAASPIVLTDRQVERAVELVGERAVVQTINYTVYRAAFNRITEAAGLSYIPAE